MRPLYVQLKRPKMQNVHQMKQKNERNYNEIYDMKRKRETSVVCFAGEFDATKHNFSNTPTPTTVVNADDRLLFQLDAFFSWIVVSVVRARNAVLFAATIRFIYCFKMFA